jgi:hypothetical protein
VRRLASTALSILMDIHNERSEDLKNAMPLYILQIDGTTDSEYSMIVVVRDFTSYLVLYSKVCNSES